MKNNRRLVHVTVSLNRGGAETVLYHLIRGLRPDFEQSVISIRDGIMADEIRALGISVYCLDGISVFTFIRLWRLLNQLKPAVIHSLLWSANVMTRVYSKKTGVPLVCAVHSPYNGNKGNMWWRSWVDRWTGIWATKTVFVAEALREQAIRDCQVLSTRALVIENGIDSEFLRETAQKTSISRATLGLSDQHVVMGTVGRLVPIKNHTLLLQVMAQLKEELPQLRLVIVGDGPLKNQLRDEIKKLGLADTVHLVAGLGVAYYSLFDFFVLPSLTEGLSMALLEAMTCGLPVLVSGTATGGVVIKYHNGLVCGGYDNADWVGFVRRLVADQSLRQTLGAVAVQTVAQSLSSQKMVSSYKQLFDEHAGQF